jgi:pyruvate-formate lyase-activating enzyme
LKNNEQLVFLNMPDTKSREEIESFCHFLKDHVPEGYRLIVGNNFHPMTKQEVELMYAQIGKVLEK